jgi:hypothetical protein
MEPPTQSWTVRPALPMSKGGATHLPSGTNVISGGYDCSRVGGLRQTRGGPDTAVTIVAGTLEICEGGYSPRTERIVSRMEYLDFHSTSFTHLEPSTAQRNWM